MKNLMENLMRFGIVLVVLTMVTSVGFAATQEYKGPDGGTWCDDDNWKDETPRDGKKDDAEIDNGNTVVIDCEPAELDELMIVDGGVQVGTATSGPFFLRVDGDLEMADSSSSDFAILDIVNGDVYVEDQSKDLAEDGDIQITIAAGSSLTLDDGVYFGDSSDGGDSVYDLDIAGDFAVNGDRIEHRGGQLIVDLTGDGTFSWEKTCRLSSDNDSVATFNLSDNATVTMDSDVELGERDDGADFAYSLAVNMSGNSTWNGAGEEIKFQDKGQILNITVTDNASLEVKDINDGDEDDGEVNITVSGNGSVEITDDCDIGQGDISITGNGSFSVADTFNLGIDDKATMTVASTGDVYVGELEMGKDGEEAKLTIDGCRVDAKRLDGMGSNSSIDILGTGSLVIDEADDPEDWDEVADLIDDGQIMTSEEGMIVVWDYGVTNDGKLTVRIALPVDVDIQPGGCPNPLRVNFIGGGVYPVAILGSEDFDVLNVDVATITLQGVSPVRSSYDDVSTFGGEACECTAEGPDGFLDLTLKFKRQDILTALEECVGDLRELEHRTEIPLTLSGYLIEPDDDILLEGVDCLRILNRGRIKTKKK